MNRKLTADEQDEIHRLYALDVKPFWSARKIGNLFGLSGKTIERVLNGRYSERPQCRKGVRFPSKIPPQAKAVAREVARSHLTFRDAAIRYGVSASTIGRWVRAVKQEKA